ncbi:MAG: TonB-dependent receptor [Sphingorhabdus sp.]
MKKAHQGKTALCSSTAALLFASTAWTPLHAQESNAENDDNVIVVTAQLREQALQDVPTAITAFDAETIESAGIRTTEDFVGLTPNVTFDDSFTYLNSFVVVRGVTQVNNADAPIAIIIDGVPQNNQKQFKQSLFDIEQIEVLKGPQGSLFGRNAIGGAINITTKQPTNDFEGFVSAGISNGTGYRGEVGVSGPIIEDKILFRVAGSYYETDGIIQNEFLNDDVDFVDHDIAIRGKLKILPTDNLSIDLRASYTDVRAGSSYDTIVNNTANTGAVPLFRAGGPNQVFAPTSDFRGFTDATVLDLSAKVDLELPFATATYILGFTDLREDYRADLDFSNPTQPSGIFGGFNLGQAQDLDVELFSHELRLVSPDDQPFRWILGGYYLDTKRDLRTRVAVDIDNSVEQFDTGFVLVNRAESNNNEAWAVFGQIEFDITDALTLQLGGRYDEDKRNQINPDAPGPATSATFDSFQPKATLSYKLSDDVLTYATYSTGFRSGGFNAPGVVLPGFSDEELTNYELGLKTQFADGRGTLNLSGFYSNSEGFQFFFVDVTTGSQIISNLDEVDIWGFEAEFQFRASDQFTFYGALGITDSEIKSIGNPALQGFLVGAGVNIANVIGSRSPKTTDLTANLGGQFTAPLTDSLDMVLRADYEYSGNKYWQLDNLDVRNPVHLMGLRGSIESEGWSASLWVKNLFDEEYYADFNPSEFAGGGFDLGFQARPRTYGVDVKLRF